MIRAAGWARSVNDPCRRFDLARQLFAPPVRPGPSMIRAADSIRRFNHPCRRFAAVRQY
jgi:hypothetical protein